MNFNAPLRLPITPPEIEPITMRMQAHPASFLQASDISGMFGLILKAGTRKKGKKVKGA